MNGLSSQAPCPQCGAPATPDEMTVRQYIAKRRRWRFDLHAAIRRRLETMPTSVIAGAVDTAFIAAKSREWGNMREAIIKVLCGPPEEKQTSNG